MTSTALSFSLPRQPMVPDSYAEYLLGRGLTAKTVRDYGRELDLALAWFESRGLDMREAAPSLLAEYAANRPNTPGVRAQLRASLVAWWEWQGVDGYPKAIPVPTQAPMVCRALSEEAARRLVAASWGWWRAGTVVLVGIHLGLRNAELAGMRWDGFDPNMEWYTLVGKGSRQRTVAVHEDLAAELIRHRRRAGSEWIFEGRSGGPVSHHAIWTWVRQVAADAGIDEQVWPHRLRHTFGATANDETGDLRAVAEAMGHVHTRTTEGYTRTTARARRQIADAVARAVR